MAQTSTSSDSETAATAERLRQTLDVIKRTGENLELGHVTVDDKGLLSQAANRETSFALICHGVHFHCHWSPEAGQGLHVTANLGSLPFTADCSTTRSSIRQLATQLGAFGHWRFLLTDRQDMCLEGEATPPAPYNLTNVLSCVVALLLEAKPFMEFLGGLLAEGERLAKAIDANPAPVSPLQAAE